MATFAPHVATAVREINNRFVKLGEGGTYPGHGEDGSQYAADFWSTSKSVHDDVFPWLRQNAKRLGIKYVISWCRIWSVERASEGVRRYFQCEIPGTSASKRHTNHVHVSFNVNPPEDDMPSLEEIADKLARDAEYLSGTSQAFLDRDGVPNLLPHDEGEENVMVKNALAEIRRDARQTRATVEAIFQKLEELEQQP